MVRLLCTAFTDLTFVASSVARSDSSLLLTVPVRSTTPWSVRILMSRPLTHLSSANAALTLVVMVASSRYCPLVSVEVSAAYAPTGPSNVPNKTKVPANLMFMIPPFGSFKPCGRRSDPYSRGASPLRLLYRLLDILFGVADRCLDRADVLLDVAFDFQVLVTHDLANDFLDLALRFFGAPLYVILVDTHVLLLRELADSQSTRCNSRAFPPEFNVRVRSVRRRTHPEEPVVSGRKALRRVINAQPSLRLQCHGFFRSGLPEMPTDSPFRFCFQLCACGSDSSRAESGLASARPWVR